MDAKFGSSVFTSEDLQRIQAVLQTNLERDQIAERVGPGNTKLSYVESWRVINSANDIFGYNGWSCSVLDLSQDYCEETNGKWYTGVSAMVRVQLKDGCFHEDIGFGHSEGVKEKGKALEKAKKQAISDARKRALRLFGQALGNSVYDKEHIKEIKKQPAQKPRIPLLAVPNGAVAVEPSGDSWSTNVRPSGIQPVFPSVGNNNGLSGNGHVGRRAGPPDVKSSAAVGLGGVTSNGGFIAGAARTTTVAANVGPGVSAIAACGVIAENPALLSTSSPSLATPQAAAMDSSEKDPFDFYSEKNAYGWGSIIGGAAFEVSDTSHRPVPAILPASAADVSGATVVPLAGRAQPQALGKISEYGAQSLLVAVPLSVGHSVADGSAVPAVLPAAAATSYQAGQALLRGGARVSCSAVQAPLPIQQQCLLSVPNRISMGQGSHAMVGSSGPSDTVTPTGCIGITPGIVSSISTNQAARSPLIGLGKALPLVQPSISSGHSSSVSNFVSSTNARELPRRLMGASVLGSELPDEFGCYDDFGAVDELLAEPGAVLLQNQKKRKPT